MGSWSWATYIREDFVVVANFRVHKCGAIGALTKMRQQTVCVGGHDQLESQLEDGNSNVCRIV